MIPLYSAIIRWFRGLQERRRTRKEQLRREALDRAVEYFDELRAQTSGITTVAKGKDHLTGEAEHG